MFGIGMPELLIIFVIALLVFGPKELPKIGRTIGKAMGEFRRASDELREGIQREIDLAEREDQSGASVPTEAAPPVASAEAPSAGTEEQPSQSMAEELSAPSLAPTVSETPGAAEPSETPRDSAPQVETASFPPTRSPETRNA